MMTLTPAFGLANPHLQTLLPRFIHRKPQFTVVTGSLLKPKMWLEKTIPVWFTEQLALNKQSSHDSQV